MGGTIARRDEGFGRRRSPRLRLAMPARLMTLDGTYPVVIEDLTDGGARITLPAPDDFVACVLRWMDRHAFAEVAWREGLSVGLRFDRALSVETLEATAIYAAEAAGPAPRSEGGLRRC